MDPARSSVVGGVAATAVLSVFLLVADALLGGGDVFVFATFMSLCAVGGPPYCALESPAATALTFAWFLALFAVAWPLLFAGFTWGLPGESGITHGVVFGLVLWTGYVVAVFAGIGLGGRTFAESFPLLGATLLAYLAYGVVLGGGYDYLAGHRTFMSRDVA